MLAISCRAHIKVAAQTDFNVHILCDVLLFQAVVQQTDRGVDLAVANIRLRRGIRSGRIGRIGVVEVCHHLAIVVVGDAVPRLILIGRGEGEQIQTSTCTRFQRVSGAIPCSNHIHIVALSRSGSSNCREQIRRFADRKDLLCRNIAHRQTQRRDGVARFNVILRGVVKIEMTAQENAILTVQGILLKDMTPIQLRCRNLSVAVLINIGIIILRLVQFCCRNGKDRIFVVRNCNAGLALEVKHNVEVCALTRFQNRIFSCIIKACHTIHRSGSCFQLQRGALIFVFGQQFPIDLRRILQDLIRRKLTGRFLASQFAQPLIHFVPECILLFSCQESAQVRILLGVVRDSIKTGRQILVILILNVTRIRLVGVLIYLKGQLGSTHAVLRDPEGFRGPLFLERRSVIDLQSVIRLGPRCGDFSHDGELRRPVLLQLRARLGVAVFVVDLNVNDRVHLLAVQRDGKVAGRAAFLIQLVIIRLCTCAGRNRCDRRNELRQLLLRHVDLFVRGVLQVHVERCIDMLCVVLDVLDLDLIFRTGLDLDLRLFGFSLFTGVVNGRILNRRLGFRIGVRSRRFGFRFGFRFGRAGVSAAGRTTAGRTAVIAAAAGQQHRCRKCKRCHADCKTTLCKKSHFSVLL